MKVIDLFCGCGGLSEGFRLAGFDIVGGVDFNAAAIRTYNRNFGEGKGVCCDLLNMTKEQIIETFGSLDDIDVIIGGPPCQGFSAANRYKTEGQDPRNRLFFEFIKFVDLAKPKAIVIENVKGIITKDNGYAKDRIEAIFRERGYSVTHRILDASAYGVPQKRSRNFFVMLKEGEFDFDTLQQVEEVVTVREAIGELYDFDNNTSPRFILRKKPKTAFQTYLRASDSSIYNHEVRYPAEKVQHRPCPHRGKLHGPVCTGGRQIFLHPHFSVFFTFKDVHGKMHAAHFPGRKNHIRPDGAHRIQHRAETVCKRDFYAAGALRVPPAADKLFIIRFKPDLRFGSHVHKHGMVFIRLCGSAPEHDSLLTQRL